MTEVYSREKNDKTGLWFWSLVKEFCGIAVAQRIVCLANRIECSLP